MAKCTETWPCLAGHSEPATSCSCQCLHSPKKSSLLSAVSCYSGTPPLGGHSTEPTTNFYRVLVSEPYNGSANCKKSRHICSQRVLSTTFMRSYTEMLQTEWFVFLRGSLLRMWCGPTSPLAAAIAAPLLTTELILRRKQHTIECGWILTYIL